MSIELTRIDFRMIHGQVITRWVPQLSINEIVAIDDDLSNDAFMQEVFKMAAPVGLKITIHSVESAVEAQNRGDFDKNRIMILFKNVKSLHDSIQKGLKLKEVQIGGLGGGPGRVAVNNAITLDKVDADILQEIEKQDVNIYLQTTPDYPSMTLTNAVSKL